MSSKEDYQTIDVEDIPGAGKPTPDYPTPHVIRRLEAGYFAHETRMQAQAERYRGVARKQAARARELKLKGLNVKASVAFAGYALTRAGVGYYQTLTLPFRPEAIRQTPKAILELPKTISKDPGAIFEIGGGTLASALYSHMRSPTKPKTPAFMDIKSVTKGPPSPGIGESPATLQPKGIFRGRTWDITRKSRGSMVLLTETLVERGKQLRSFDALRGIAYTPALSVRQVTRPAGPAQVSPDQLRDAPDYLISPHIPQATVLKPEPFPGIQEYKVASLPGYKPPPPLPDIIIKDPLAIPIQTPIFDIRTHRRAVAVPTLKQFQTQKQKQLSVSSAIQITGFGTPTKTKLYFLEERRKKRMGRKGIKAIREKRLRPIKARSVKDWVS